MTGIFGKFALIVLVNVFISNLVFAQSVILPRSALVIGNAKYQSLEQLKNASNDAVEVGAALREMGFSVHTGQAVQNAGRTKMYEVLDGFIAEVQAHKGLALVYYSGHGLEIDGANYLLPTDIVASSQESVRRDAISLGDIMRRLAASGVSASAIILDACRDNQLPKFGKGADEGGLALVTPPRGMFVLYAASANAKSYDRLNSQDVETTGVFTRVLLKHIKQQPTSDIRQIALAVRGDVDKLANAAGRVQFPAYYDQLVGDFRFSASKVAFIPINPSPQIAANEGSKSTIQTVTNKQGPDRWVTAKISNTYRSVAPHTTIDENLVVLTRESINVVDRNNGELLRRLPAIENAQYSGFSINREGTFVVAVGRWMNVLAATVQSPKPVFWDLKTGQSGYFEETGLTYGNLFGVDISPIHQFVAASGVGVVIYSRSGEVLAKWGDGVFALQPTIEKIRWVSDSLLVALEEDKVTLLEFNSERGILQELGSIKTPMSTSDIRVDLKNLRVAVIPSRGDNGSNSSRFVVYNLQPLEAEKFKTLYSVPIVNFVKEYDSVEPLRRPDDYWKISDVVFGWKEGDKDAVTWVANRCNKEGCRANTVLGTPAGLNKFSISVVPKSGDKLNKIIQTSKGNSMVLWESGELSIGPNIVYK